ncbi:B12-binding domain-containing radical SAM protein [Treponema denticola]|uniref:B12-binding domain-containing radical SAM protein n=1 Tax=Treponema denticola TaxID=158 RepID=UPI003D8ECF22
MYTKDILLIHPPQWTYDMPPAGISQLAGELEINLNTYEIFDINVDFYNYFLFSKKVKEIIQLYKYKIKIKSTHLEKILLNILDDIEKHIPNAVNFLRKKNASLNELQFSENLLNIYFEAIVSKVLEPIKITKTYFSFGTNFDTLSNLLYFAENFKNDLILKFLKKYIDSFNNFYIVGFSVSTIPQLIFSLLLIILAKKNGISFPKYLIGGSLLTSYVKQKENFSKLFHYCDFIMLYEGDFQILKLINFVKNKTKISNVKNLVFKDSNGKIITNNFIVETQDRKTCPSFKKLPLNKYLCAEPVIPIVFSQSCYGKCIFCAARFDSSLGCWKTKSANMVFSEMTKINNTYNANAFFFCDLTMPIYFQRSLAKLLISSNKKYKWVIAARLDNGYTKQHCKLLYKAGCRKIAFGLESFNDSILKHMNKGTSTSIIQESINNIFEAGIIIELFIIKNFPGEKVNQFAETINFLLKNIKKITNFSIVNFVAMENADIIKKKNIQLELNDIKKDDDLYFHRYTIINDGIPIIEKQKKELIQKKFINHIMKDFEIDRDNYYKTGYPISVVQQLSYNKCDIVFTVKTKNIQLVSSIKFYDSQISNYIFIPRTFLILKINDQQSALLKIFRKKVNITVFLNDIHTNDDIKEIYSLIIFFIKKGVLVYV